MSRITSFTMCSYERLDGRLAVYLKHKLVVRWIEKAAFSLCRILVNMIYEASHRRKKAQCNLKKTNMVHIIRQV